MPSFSFVYFTLIHCTKERGYSKCHFKIIGTCHVICFDFTDQNFSHFLVCKKCQNFMIFDSENSKYLEFCFGNCVVFWREKIFVIILDKIELKLLKQFTDQK